jgi:hypothetical protein
MADVLRCIPTDSPLDPFDTRVRDVAQLSHQAILGNGAQILALDVAVEGQSGFARWYQDMRRDASFRLRDRHHDHELRRAVVELVDGQDQRRAQAGLFTPARWIEVDHPHLAA